MAWGMGPMNGQKSLKLVRIGGQRSGQRYLHPCEAGGEDVYWYVDVYAILISALPVQIPLEKIIAGIIVVFQGHKLKKNNNSIPE